MLCWGWLDWRAWGCGWLNILKDGDGLLLVLEKMLFAEDGCEPKNMFWGLGLTIYSGLFELVVGFCLFYCVTVSVDVGYFLSKRPPPLEFVNKFDPPWKGDWAAEEFVNKLTALFYILVGYGLENKGTSFFSTLFNRGFENKDFYSFFSTTGGGLFENNDPCGISAFNLFGCCNKENPLFADTVGDVVVVDVPAWPNMLLNVGGFA